MDGAEITTAIVAKKGAILKGVQLCDPKDKPDYHLEYGYASGCFNNVCETTITFGDKPVPTDLAIYRKYHDQCVPQNLPNIAQYVRVVEYEADIGLDAATIQHLGVTDAQKTELVRTSNSKFNANSMLNLNSDVKFTLGYKDKPPGQDEFRLGDKLITVKYTGLAAMPDSIQQNTPPGTSPTPNGDDTGITLTVPLHEKKTATLKGVGLLYDGGRTHRKSDKTGPPFHLFQRPVPDGNLLCQ